MSVGSNGHGYEDGGPLPDLTSDLTSDLCLPAVTGTGMRTAGRRSGTSTPQSWWTTESPACPSEPSMTTTGSRQTSSPSRAGRCRPSRLDGGGHRYWRGGCSSAVSHYGGMREGIVLLRGDWESVSAPVSLAGFGSRGTTVLSRRVQLQSSIAIKPEKFIRNARTMACSRELVECRADIC